MGIGDKSGSVQTKLPGSVHVGIVDRDIDHVGEKEAVTAERLDFPHLTFDIYRAFRNAGDCDFLRGERR